jgi:small-conductance mechanosensitive channel
MEAAMTFLNLTFLNNSLASWLAAMLIFVAILVILLALRNHLLARVIKLMRINRLGADEVALDLISHTRSYFIFGLALFSGSLALNFPDRIEAVLQLAIVAIALLQSAVWGTRFIDHTVNRVVARRQQSDVDNTAGIKLIGLVVRIAVWVVVALIILENIPGLKVDSLVTSLGISGIAVAFALQRILGDLFASFSIALDKPFVEGDFIVVGDYQGTVERIGLKSTRLRSLQGEQIVISNSDLLASRVQNFKRMRDRRVSYLLKVPRKTPQEQLEQIPEMVKELIDSQPSVRFNRAHLREISENAFIYEIVYFLLSPDYDVYMDVQQSINLAMIQLFAGEEIQFTPR